MIYDKLDKLETYASISDDIRIGLEWLRDVSPEVEKGVYELSSRVKAIVSEYDTKEVNENGYESHRDYIDIQYLISGVERISCLPLEYLEEMIPYNKDIDAAFYQRTNYLDMSIQIGNRYFAILYPQDGHMPCLSVGEPEPVKKVVVKVKI